MTKEELSNLVEPEKVEKIINTAEIVGEYLQLKTITEMGLTVHHSEIAYDKMILFSWIKEELKNGREHRV